MSDVIGTTAGQLWHFLDEHGPQSVTKTSQDSGIEMKQLQRAIGWLAKEGKIEIIAQGRTEILSLLATD